MEERILVHRSPEYQKWLDFCKYRLQELQELVNGMKQLSIEPTLENLKRLLNGEDLTNLSVASDMEKHLSFLPNRLKSSLIESAAKELEEEYNEVLGNKVKEFIYTYDQKHSGTISLSKLCKYLNLANGRVSINNEFQEWIESSNSVFIDSPGRKSVYDAYHKFIEAYKELEQAVKEAPKKPNHHYMGQTFGFDHNCMRALGGEDAYAVVKLIDGNLKLDGSCIGDLQ